MKYIQNIKKKLKKKMKKYNLKELEEKLEKCKNIPVNEINLDEIDDLDSIKIDRRKSPNERILDFIANTKNPYAFKVNGKIVKIEFCENDRKAEDAITDVIKDLYR